MLTVYSVSLGIGGTLVMASLLLGGDSDIDADVDIDVDVDGDVDGGQPLDYDVGGALGWMPLKSVRFWVFFLAFFGLTGFLIVLAEGGPLAVHLPVSLGVAYLAGVVSVKAIRHLQSKDADRGIASDDYLGQTGTVTVPIDAKSPGKVQLELKGQSIELLALGEDGKSFASGDKVMVFEVNEKGMAVATEQQLSTNEAHGGRDV